MTSHELPIYVRFACPSCHAQRGQPLPESDREIRCPACGWFAPIPAERLSAGKPNGCVVCGCQDLWRQKDFPQRIGVLFVAAGAVLSTIAWAWYKPLWAFGILMFFAALDLIFFALMRDVLVCYRCNARYKRVRNVHESPSFDLGTLEKYRNEAHRLKTSSMKSE